jgi:hypothetical protein
MVRRQGHSSPPWVLWRCSSSCALYPHDCGREGEPQRRHRGNGERPLRIREWTEFSPPSHRWIRSSAVWAYDCTVPPRSPKFLRSARSRHEMVRCALDFLGRGRVPAIGAAGSAARAALVHTTHRSAGPPIGGQSHPSPVTRALRIRITSLDAYPPMCARIRRQRGPSHGAIIVWLMRSRHARHVRTCCED